MIKLNDLQLVLLSAAAQRDDGSLLPPPGHLADQAARIRKVIPPLIKHGLVEETPTDQPDKVWRESEGERLALIITKTGRRAIGLGDDSGAAALPSIPLPPASARGTPSKSMLVLTLLGREQGASLEELAEATGWLPHSTRAALSGLRKKGHAILLDKCGERRCYRLGA
ncbi:MAG TPA: DUF3489 domain-containing protein [Sphingobium sp.]|nr:DUF3489 domain-containing protein [Sphingobium sp.]